MTTLPPILIATDRGHFVAYRFHNGSIPEVLHRASFKEGTDKLSELVTDQAGRFPSAGGSLSYRNSAAERPKLILELENRCVRHIAEHISDVLLANSGTWALAAPGEINGPILDLLTPDFQNRLQLNLHKDLVHTPATEIADHFIKARQHA